MRGGKLHIRPAATKLMVVNAVAALIGIAAVLSGVRSIFISPTAAPCSERYNHMTAFALDRGGVTLAAADLQSTLGGKDVGVMDNLTATALTDGPAPLALSIALGRSREKKGQTEVVGGVAFPWEPRALHGKPAACLTYYVLFPAGFDFSRGGRLPGIAGGEEPGDRFHAPVTWGAEGAIGTMIRVTQPGAIRAAPAERDGYAFPRGAWVKVEQEVVLNRPGQADGMLRLWRDGALVIERTEVAYRSNPSETITRIAFEAFYGSGPDDVRAAPAENAQLAVTSLQVRW